MSLNLFTRISTRYCLYDALSKMPYFRKFWIYSRVIVNWDWFEWCLFSSKSQNITEITRSSHCERTSSILSEALEFFFFVSPASLSIESNLCFAAWCFPFLHRFIFSKVTTNLQSNRWRLDWATILRWIKAQVDINSLLPVRIGLKTAKKSILRNTDWELFQDSFNLTSCVSIWSEACGMTLVLECGVTVNGSLPKKYALDFKDETANKSAL